MREGDRCVGDPGYIGHTQIVFPPRSNMLSYIPGLNNVWLTLQRVVERVNQLPGAWGMMQFFRASPVHAWTAFGRFAVVHLLSLDMRMNEYEFY